MIKMIWVFVICKKMKKLQSIGSNSSTFSDEKKYKCESQQKRKTIRSTIIRRPDAETQPQHKQNIALTFRHLPLPNQTVPKQLMVPTKHSIVAEWYLKIEWPRFARRANGAFVGVRPYSVRGVSIVLDFARMKMLFSWFVSAYCFYSM